MQKYDTIEITFKSGQSVVWRAGEWDAYARDGGLFIIAKDGNPIGFYSLDCVACIVVEKSGEEDEAAEAPSACPAEAVHRTMGVGQASMHIGQASTAMGQSSTAIGPETTAAGSGPSHAVGGFAPGESYRHIEGTPVDPKSCHGHAEGALVPPGDDCRHAEDSQADLVECEVAVALPVEHGIRL